MSDNHWTDPRDAEIARLETICAEMEAEIEAACREICGFCFYGSWKPAERSPSGGFIHRSGIDGDTRINECAAHRIREHCYQRQLKGSK